MSRLPSLAELRQAYRTAALRWHPDRPQNHERRAQATAQFQRAQEAFEQLSRELLAPSG
eukprot:COSAG01_NODE_58084_length_308_cov_0.789474_1_plen_59_part_00